MAAIQGEEIQQTEAKEQPIASQDKDNSKLEDFCSDNSQPRSDVRSISDDQKLFLKVLENLKNAVSAKPDKKAIAMPKSTSKDTALHQSIFVSSKTADDKGISGIESLTRSDTEEPGTTTVTVSDKTKSLILQKLAFASDLDKTKPASYNSYIISSAEKSGKQSGNLKDSKISNAASNQTTDPDSVKMELVKLTVMGFDNVANKMNEKESLSASSKTVNKENMDFQMDNIASTSSSPKVVRLIAPATPPVKLYPCNFCDYYSENKNYLKQHMDLVHNSDRPFKCPYCDYAGKRSHALREHLIVHSNERPYQCKSCNATFRKKGHLTNHIKLHNSKRLVKCPVCKVLVYDTGENGLDAHLKNDHDTERLYGCDLCEHVAASEPEILKHLNEKHKSKIGIHTCDKCPFQTANNLDFEGHIQAHNITESSVQIGNNTPSKVIGVATLPAGSHTLETPNSTVKVAPNQDESRRQPAVIKPVWIKCSECGFTGQDSEVIRKHMIEHLRDQYGGEVSSKDLPASPNPEMSATVSKPQTAVLEKQPVATSKHSAKTPILVPVSKRLDMNAPVLVPVSDAAILKSLRSSSVTPLQLAGASITTSSVDAPANIVESHKTSVRKVSNSGIVTLSTSAPVGQQVVAKAAPLTPQPFPMHLFQNCVRAVGPDTVSQHIPSKVVGVPKEQPVTQNPVFTSPSGLKIIPVKLTSDTWLTQDLGGSSSSAMPSNISSGISSANSTNDSSSSACSTVSVSDTNRKPAAPYTVTLTEIPVPRAMNIDEIPKLPPEVLQLKSPVVVEEENQVADKAPELKEQQVSGPQNIEALRESIANVQKLIDQQEEMNRQAGNVPVLKLDSRGIPEKNNTQKVVCYMTPVGKMNTSKNKPDPGFTHDNTAGRFRCTLCGYTCEFQRTIKAHIWKHSGNKDIYYPMFQNGPLSIYEDGSLTNPEHEENRIEITEEHTAENVAVPVQGFKVLTDEMNMADGKMPPFIVYEQTKISNVAPALAHLIAARTMVGLFGSDNKEDTNDSTAESGKDQKYQIKVNDSLSVCVTAEQLKSIEEFEEMEKKKQALAKDEGKKDSTQYPVPVNANVIVEAVNSVSMSGFTGLNSQQSSPRITPAPKSPDSGVSEQTFTSKTIEDQSTSSGFVSPLPNFEYITEDTKGASNTQKDPGKTWPQADKQKKSAETDNEEGPPAKKSKVSNREDSAVTLLSLLQKGPNYNPACPPKTGQVDKSSDEINQANSLGQEDSNSMGESDVNGPKPKSGISTSLLAVIEQLRERSKADPEDEKTQGSQQAKRQSRRRSRKSSYEDNAPATGIDNVEEFVTEGVVKFRCKLCHYKNDSTMLLKQHMRLHKPKQEFECSLCDHIAESSEALQDHMIQHCKVRTYQCKLCNSAFNYKSQLRAHMRMHNDQDILLCDFCDFETRSVSALKAHTKSHLTKPPYKCELCKEEFITSFNLRIHKREGCFTSVDKGGNFKCDECEYTTVSRREMKNHQRVHMGRSTIPTKKRCPYCDNMAMTIEQIQQHIVDVHGESTPLKCEMCGFIAVSIRSLKSHMKRHVNDQRFVAQPLEQYKCNLCGYVCHHLPSLKSHMWRHAADQHYSYEFTNDVINAAIDFDSQTETVDTTQTHVMTFKKFIFDKMKAKGLEHTRESEEESAVTCCWVTFRCCQCGFETINKAELNMHMADHSDVIKWTLDVSEDDKTKRKQVTQILHG